MNSPATPPQPEMKPRPARRLALCVVILSVGALGLAIALQRNGTDSAMVFVGVPTFLALAIALSPPARSVHGLTFKAVSISLLLAAVLVREGAICVLFAAPLIFAVAHGVVAIVQHDRRGPYAVVPLALLLSMEGLVPGVRLVPEQTVTVTRFVALSPAQVQARLVSGPDVVMTRPSGLLGLLPLPAHAGGTGLEPGDTWLFHFDGDSHGPGGVLTTEVTAHTATAVRFRTVSDTSVVHRWLDWTTSDLEWQADGAGTTVTLTLRFTRGLDPSWYFGPIEQFFVRASAGYLLDTLGLAG